MAYSTTYDRLLTIAAGALGLDRSHLGADERAKLNNIPNQAVADVAAERPWLYLLRSLTLQSVAGLYTYLLPADFAQFWRPGAFNYSKASGFPKLGWTDLVSIRNLRAAADTSGTPEQVTLGETVAELEDCSAVAGGSGSLSGVHKYRYRWLDSGGIVQYSEVASVTHAGSTANATVSGWPAEAGTVTLYRTKLGGSILYAVPGAAAINSASSSSYVDSTADASLGTDTFPQAPLASEVLIGRQQIELHPCPFEAYVYTGSYRRLPATMSAGGDTPDIPVALTSALEARTRVVAYEEFTRPVPQSAIDSYQRLLAAAERLLMDQNPGNGEPLRDIMGRMDGLPRGRQIDLTSNWNT